jgi:hypothetical protein
MDRTDVLDVLVFLSLFSVTFVVNLLKSSG